MLMSSPSTKRSVKAIKADFANNLCKDIEAALKAFRKDEGYSELVKMAIGAKEESERNGKLAEKYNKKTEEFLKDCRSYHIKEEALRMRRQTPFTTNVKNALFAVHTTFWVSIMLELIFSFAIKRYYGWGLIIAFWLSFLATNLYDCWYKVDWPFGIPFVKDNMTKQETIEHYQLAYNEKRFSYKMILSHALANMLKTPERNEELIRLKMMKQKCDKAISKLGSKALKAEIAKIQKEVENEKV